jgi:hypothetical protein
MTGAGHAANWLFVQVTVLGLHADGLQDWVVPLLQLQAPFATQAPHW